MRSKVLWFLLTASLALNVFFVAGVIWPRLMGHPYPPHGRDPVAAAAEQFKRDDRQVAALDALRKRPAERPRASRGPRDGLQALTLHAMRQPAFARATLPGAL